MSAPTEAEAGEWYTGPNGEMLRVLDAPAATHTVKITSHLDGAVFEVDVPEDRYVLMEAERQGYELPFACRMGACTQCAIKVRHTHARARAPTLTHTHTHTHTHRQTDKHLHMRARAPRPARAPPRAR